MNKLLVVAPSWVGDVMISQSLYAYISMSYPQAQIDVLAPVWCKDILLCMPQVTDLYEMPVEHGKLAVLARYRLAKMLRTMQYDWAIVLPNSFKSALIPWFAGIPKRTGWLGEMRWGLLNDVRYGRKKSYPTLVQRFVALAKPAPVTLQDCPQPRLTVDVQTVGRTLERYALSVTHNTPIIALCPGAEYGWSKRWPLEYFVDVAQYALKRGHQVWIFGSGKDEPIAQQIEQATDGQCMNLVGRTSLCEVVDLLSRVDYVVTNDSGLMHVAASLSKPMVAIYGPTSPQYTPPLTDGARILRQDLECQPCFKRTCIRKHWRCMRDITPQMVITDLQRVLDS